MRICFILGVQRRSGTNYLFHLLAQHQDCIAPGPIWEDYLLNYSEHLSTFTSSLFQKWNKEWDVEHQVESEDQLLRRLGESLKEFLVKQAGSLEAQVFLTKTPSVRNLPLFFRLFPDDKLLVIIRDGRSVVESGVRSFDQDYEKAIRRWSNGAEAIDRFRQEHETNPNFKLVRYEDIYCDTENQLKEVLRFMELDPSLYPFQKAENLPLFGSSELRQDGNDEVHWEPVHRDKSFNPLARFSDWERRQHERFNWLAGEQMTKFGYELQMENSLSSMYAVLNKYWDFEYITRQRIRKLKRLLRSARDRL